MIVEEIAVICHEANKVLCRMQGDNSQKSWADAEQWQRDSAINGVKFHIANPDASPAASHNSWLREKLDNGWVYGEVKDAEAKTHPCIQDYEDLPRQQQAKDYLFKSIVSGLAPFIG